MQFLKTNNYNRLKNEMFYNHNWLNVSIDEFIDEPNKYIEWYSHKRKKWIKSNILQKKFRIISRVRKSKKYPYRQTDNLLYH